MGNIFKSIRAQSAQGLAIKDDGNNTAIFIEDGGQVGIGTTAPASAFHVIGETKVTLGIVPTTQVYYTGGQTQNTIFDRLAVFVPNTNDEKNLTGAARMAGSAYNVSHIKRTSATKIVISRSYQSGAAVDKSTCNDASTASYFDSSAFDVI